MKILKDIRYISWNDFETINNNPTDAFEKMCRMLFKYTLFDEKTFFHSNTNHPGVEIEPLYCSKVKKTVSFQSKYFTKVDYSQIRNSVEKTIKYYSNEIEVVYLFCNKTINKTTKSYIEIEKSLKDNNIELILICNDELLTIVKEYSNIAHLFFNYHFISDAMIDSQLQTSLDTQGERFNSIFNVDTTYDNYMDLFSNNENAINLINQKKASVLQILENNKYKFFDFRELANNIYEHINSIKEVELNTLSNCTNWKNDLLNAFNEDIKKVITELEKNRLSENTEILHEYYLKKSNFDFFIRTLEILDISQLEKDLLFKKVLFINGEAGSGKSQLFSITAKKLREKGIVSVLFLGSFFLSNAPCHKQIMDHLDIAINIEDFLEALSTLGEIENNNSIILIDAINETPYNEIWSNGVLQLIQKVNKLSNVRIAFSIRTGYEDIIPFELNQFNKDFVQFTHTGFSDNSIIATKTFLNQYNIPFTFNSVLQHKITNPLFLTLLCKTNTHSDQNIENLFISLITYTASELNSKLKKPIDSECLYSFSLEVCNSFILNNKKNITKKELLNLNFWGIYGLNNLKLEFISILSTVGLLNEFRSKEETIYFFGYNLLEDYIISLNYFNQYSTKDDLIFNIKNQILLKDESDLIYSNIDVFLFICSKFYETYKLECIDLIKNIEDLEDRQHVAEKYVESFLWRSAKNTSKQFFLDFISEYQIDYPIVWKVLITCSLTENHPLNADILHETLYSMKLADRDYHWTIFINEIEEDDRLYQLIDYFDKGFHLDLLENSNPSLACTLFSWLLSSSNRSLRDKASKALIELLKENFELCTTILRKFENTNDPYILQRLYTVVLGACLKRNNKDAEQYLLLIKYIYTFIFNKKYVYPDILLRDSAKLIIDRYIEEFKHLPNDIDYTKIKPPYTSKNFSLFSFDNTIYNSESSFTGFEIIKRSMQLGNAYGDFGRYVFESALKHFKNVNIQGIQEFALMYILEILGYRDDLFSEYDNCSYRSVYGRHNTRKIERIGKKYQWIAFYDILARCSDMYQLKDWNDNVIQYSGCWNPYVRDFDPTLNVNFLDNPDAPTFEQYYLDKAKHIDENLNQNADCDWVNSKCEFFDNHSNKLLIIDDTGIEWISLYEFTKIEDRNPNIIKKSLGFDYGDKELWSISQAYFTKNSDFTRLHKNLKDVNFLGRCFPESETIYTVYNREYYWSVATDLELNNDWIDYKIKVGESVGTTKTRSVPILKTSDGENIKDEELEKIEISDIVLVYEEQDYIEKEDIFETIGEIMPAFNSFLWEEEYDASQTEPTSFIIPCKSIVSTLQLSQSKYDGYFYSKSNELVAFDMSLYYKTNNEHQFIIRKDYLETYLDKTNTSLFWTCMGEKNYFLESFNKNWSEWSGFLKFSKDSIVGKVELKHK